MQSYNLTTAILFKVDFYCLLLISLSMASLCSTHSTSKPIVDLTASELSCMIRSRTISCVQVMESYLIQIEKLNNKVNAIIERQPSEDLFAIAIKYDEMLDRGEWKGFLHGFPLAVKNLALTKGIESSFGSPILKGFIPDEDSIVIERMRRAGAIIIGK